MRRLLLVLVLAPACLTATEGDYGPSDYFPFEPDSQFIEQRMPCAGLCPIALGGTDLIEIDANEWENVHVVTEGPLTQTKLLHPLPGAQLIELSADAIGASAIEVRGELRGTERIFHRVELSALPVDQVRLRAFDQIYTQNAYTPVFATDRIAWHTMASAAVVELRPAGAGVSAPRFLVDTSIALGDGTDPRVRQRHSHVLELGGAGSFEVVVQADSFSAQRFEVTVVDHVERIEAEVVQRPTRITEDGIVCFHAYTGELEIALPGTAYEITIEHAYDFGRGHIADNCRKFRASEPGLTRVSVEAAGARGEIELTIAP